MLELKEYQRGTLEALARWLEALEGALNSAGRMVVSNGPRRKGIFQPDNFRRKTTNNRGTVKDNADTSVQNYDC